MSENIGRRAIAHIDCDAFFASCEEARDPSLRGKPVVTGRERGIIACANYRAKALGVRRGVSLRDAKLMCPELIVLPSDYETYSLYSERMFSIIRRFTPEVEEYSIDEAFCDLTGLRRLYRTSYSAIARSIKDTIQKELDITVSVGLSSSKTLAKICSRQDKPDGFIAVSGMKLNAFLKTVPLERVCGFGPNTVGLLNKCGIKCVADFTARPVIFAQKLLGKIGGELWSELRGVPVYKINTEAKEKYLTISKTKTFSPHSGNIDIVKGQLMRNLESAFIKLRRHGLSCRNINAYLIMVDYSSIGIEGRINRHSSSTLDFTRISAELFTKVFEAGAVYRATGVILSDIAAEGVDSIDLFDDPVRIEKTRCLGNIIDKVNEMYGKHSLHIASSSFINHKAPHERNASVWRKSALLKGETFRKRLNIPLLKLSG